MYRKVISGLATGLILIGTIGIAETTPVVFDVSGADKSSVTLTNIDCIIGTNSLEASLAQGLDATVFTLNDGESESSDFFTLTASGFGIGTANISATLGFDDPDDPNLLGSGDGGVIWGTFCGWISGGYLYWDGTTLPDLVTLADGNSVSINFESGIQLIPGDTVTVRATVSNLGGRTAPVPEAANMLLLGTGLVGLAGLARKKSK